jgi:2-amino-4-hydroxy-6-hydroxymethyldihydropteridine diphosphokinase
MAPPTELVYLSIGSNVGDRLENLRQACLSLLNSGLRLRAVSSVYETEPVDVLEQNWFLNIAVEVETSLSPQELLEEVHAIERKLGRIREQPKGPRSIDIDILLYANATIQTANLLLPHPRMLDRRFVLEPLREIAATLRVPPRHRTIRELLEELKDPSQVRRVGALVDVPLSP